MTTGNQAPPEQATAAREPASRFRPTTSHGVCLTAIVVVSVLSLLLRWRIPLNPVSYALGFFDGGLFERSAVALARRDWLGPLDTVTLSKGPGYPAFIALTHQWGIPLHLGTQMVYLAGAGCMAICVWLVLRRLLAATTVYVILALDPANFSYDAANILRDNFYGAIALLFVSLFFIAVFCSVTAKLWRWSLVAGVLAGLSGALFWLTREEGSWLAPTAMVIVIALPVIALLKSRWGSKPWRERWQGPSRVAATLVLVAATFVAPIVFVGQKNERVYGVNLTNDLTTGEFAAAYGAWTRVRGVPLLPYVPINKAQREAVYQISPAASQLSAVLESPDNGWKQQGCAYDLCDEFAGGWAVWAIRDAASQAGHFGSESEFQAFFQQVATDISTACDDGRLECAVGVPPALQPLLRASIPDTAESFFYWLAQLPVNASYYSLIDAPEMSRVSDTDRASIGQGMSGIPGTDAGSDAELSEFDSFRPAYVWLGRLFFVVFLVLIAMAVLGLVLSVLWRRERSRNLPLWVLTGSLAIGVGMRLFVFAVLDTTQYYVDPRYHSVTRSFLLSLVSIGAVVLIEVLRTRTESRRGDPIESVEAGTISR